MSGNRSSGKMSASSRRAPVRPRDSQQQQSAGSIRQRARRACDPCRRRKKKCNGEIPCQTCLAYEYECFYGDVESQESSDHLLTPSIPHTQQQLHTALPMEGLAAFSDQITPPVFNLQQPLSPFALQNEMGVIEPLKLRYFDAASAMVFPRSLAMSLHSEDAPRLHSFAYNCGIRQERFFTQEKILLHFLSFEEARRYAKSFFETIQPHFSILGTPKSFLDELRDCWDVNKLEDEANLMSEIVCCWVIALGSFYSWPESFARETELVQRAEAVLDRATFHEAPSLIRLNHARAWIYRTMYYRTTTRPNIAWMTSSMAVNVCESLGLHKEVDTLKVMEPDLPAIDAEEREMRRKIFWTAVSINRLISFEYGRSHTFVSGINARTPTPVPGDDTATIVETANVLYQYSDDPLNMKAEQCLLTLDQLASSQNTYSPLLAMMRSEVACGLYRRLRALDRNIAHQSVDGLMKLGRLGLAGCRACIDEGKPWFKLISTPFQFACAVISIGDLRTLDAVSEALSLLYDIQQKFQTNLAKEAYDTARLLLEIASQAREQELAVLRNALREKQDVIEPVSGFSQADLDWAAFLNQEYLPTPDNRGLHPPP